jgi:hypothetical protein
MLPFSLGVGKQKEDSGARNKIKKSTWTGLGKLLGNYLLSLISYLLSLISFLFPHLSPSPLFPSHPLLTKIRFKTMEDWYKISKRNFWHNQGHGLLAIYFTSPAKIVTSVYLSVLYFVLFFFPPTFLLLPLLLIFSCVLRKKFGTQVP